MSLHFTQMKTMRYVTMLFSNAKKYKTHSVNHSLWIYTFRLGSVAMNFSKKITSTKSKDEQLGPFMVINFAYVFIRNCKEK